MNTITAILIGIAVYCALVGLVLALFGIDKIAERPAKEVRRIRAGTAWGNPLP